MRFKGKNRTVGRLLIDLTPLLDVIFILLIVVVCYQDNYKIESDAIRQEAKQVEDRANDRVEQAQAMTEAIQGQLDTYVNLNDYVNIVEIYATYQPSDRKNRTIYIRYNDKEKTISLNAANTARAWQECETYLSTVLDASPDSPMVLKIMDERMLYRDEQRINEMFAALCGKYDNLYLRNYTETQDE